MKKLSLLDLIFFVVESEDSPKHVAGLLRCRKPPGSPRNYARELVKELKTHDQLVEPFNLVIDFIGPLGPHWELAENVPIDEHIFYHRPKRAISWHQALDLVAELHEPLMDRAKPLWEFHLIDNIRGSRFAIYIKMHHAYADGMTMTSWFKRSFTESPEDLRIHPIWEMRPAKHSTSGGRSLLQSILRLPGQALEQGKMAGGIAKLTLQQLVERAGLTKNAVALLFNTGSDTPFTGSATPGRFLATSSLPLQDVKRLSAKTRSTLNHVALTCIDGAMHRYLDEIGYPVDHPVSIQMPVNLRRDDDSDGGNKLGIVLVDLAGPAGDRWERHQEIGFKLRNVKNQVFSVPGSSFEQFTIMIAGISEVLEKLGLSDKLPGNGHTVVSNVPGPVRKLYIMGSEVERMYPISTLAPGLRMNITLFSYADVLHFGIVATQDMVSLQTLADCIVDEFRELEHERG